MQMTAYVVAGLMNRQIVTSLGGCAKKDHHFPALRPGLLGSASSTLGHHIIKYNTRPPILTPAQQSKL